MPGIREDGYPADPGPPPGAALWNARQTGLDKQQAVQEKLAELAIWREGINAHLTAAVAMGERSPLAEAGAKLM